MPFPEVCPHLWLAGPVEGGEQIVAEADFDEAQRERKTHNAAQIQKSASPIVEIMQEESVIGTRRPAPKSSARPIQGDAYQMEQVLNSIESMEHLSKLPTPAIESAVATHEALRASGDGAAADRIREQLHRAGIHIDDNARMWRSADGRQGTACSGHCTRPDLFESVPRSVS
jgi:cysteinyl-tRNA synthetase